METLEKYIADFENDLQQRFNPFIRVNVFYAVNPINEDKVTMHFGDITTIVCNAAGIDKTELLMSKRGDRTVSDCRMVAMYYCYRLVERNYSKIGNYFNRNHSTVIVSIETVTNRIYVNDAAIVKLINDVNKSFALTHGCKIKSNDHEN